MSEAGSVYLESIVVATWLSNGGAPMDTLGLQPWQTSNGEAGVQSVHQVWVNEFVEHFSSRCLAADFPSPDPRGSLTVMVTKWNLTGIAANLAWHLSIKDSNTFGRLAFSTRERSSIRESEMIDVKRSCASKTVSL